MTVQQAETILAGIKPEVKVAFSHRFAGDRGTILRLTNYAMINIFDDGRYYIQGRNTAQLIEAFGKIEPVWDPETYSPEPVLPYLPELPRISRRPAAPGAPLENEGPCQEGMDAARPAPPEDPPKRF
jgi:hypothetical protein